MLQTSGCCTLTLGMIVLTIASFVLSISSFVSGNWKDGFHYLGGTILFGVVTLQYFKMMS